MKRIGTHKNKSEWAKGLDERSLRLNDHTARLAKARHKGCRTKPIKRRKMLHWMKRYLAGTLPVKPKRDKDNTPAGRAGIRHQLMLEGLLQRGRRALKSGRK